MAKASRNDRRKRRHLRVRSKITGTAERPRLNVFRSLSHIYAQIIDDVNGRTLAAASSLEDEVQQQAKGKSKSERARLVGAAIAARAEKEGVKEVIFDRGGYRYQGRVRALAEAAREAGLDF